ncbi:MAG TPA: Wzz/FepE/Etk N-terminal domain-containing protein [Candidatus Krumholzibacteria bacterium]|nr:Wzz/FepE/Etk N-terminal domain-containing protein [Candidatus Krumholzibacteria bacterium]
MTQDASVPAAGGTPPRDDFLSLAEILNILWRRKVMILLITLAGLAAGIAYGIVVKPLYRATATVRPGITNYQANGNPERSWLIKDVVKWYSQILYAKGVRDSLGWPTGSPVPLIDAEFIPRGVGVQGGDVITLNMLHVDPTEARTVLEASIGTFNRYAEINSVGNSISLARANLRNQIDQFANDRENIDVKRALLNIEIERAQRELEQIKVEEKVLDLKIREHAVLMEQRAQKADELEAGVGDVTRGLEEMNGLLDRLQQKEARESARDSLLAAAPADGVLPLPWWELLQDKTAMTGELLVKSLELEAEVWDDKLQAVDLRATNRAEDLRHQASLLTQRFDLANRKELVRLKIMEKELNRDRALEQEVVDIDDEIRLLQSRLDVLTSLEKVGEIAVTDKPVRPRKSRAAGLLTAAALFGGVVLAFVWEYVERNRRTIFATGPRA